jgi:porphobilinogen deaminase
MTVLRVGTRGSALALAQTRAIAERIGAKAGVEIELVPVTTHGDTSRESLAELGGTGVFVNALRDALLRGECDLIVHSLKDLPTAPAEGIVLAAVPRRADPRDVICARDGLTLDTLPEGARVGTGSPRRVAQLKAARPDVEVVDIRGNVDTRLARALDPATDDDRRLDAVVLAAAGLDRLGRSDAATQYLELSEWPTAPGQGALALETRGTPGRADVDRAVARALDAADHATTHACTAAERAVLAGLGAGCSAPLAATALVEDGLLFLSATVYRPDGSERITSSHAASLESVGLPAMLEAADEAARRVVTELLDAGAADIAPLGSAS